MQGGEPNVYAAVVTMRNTYLQMQWQRIQIVIAYNVVAFPIALSAVADDTLQGLISWIGMSIHVLMLIANRRSERWIRFYEIKLSTLERFSQVNQTQDILRVPLFSDPEFIEIRNSRTASKRLFGYFGIMVLLVWTSIYLSFIL